MERQFQEAMNARDRGDLTRAQTLLSTLHKEHPGIFAVDESLGLLLASQNEVGRALPLLETAVHEQPSSDAAHANLGAAYYKLHRNQPAIAQFEQAVRINPANASALESLGRLYMESRRPAEAAHALLAALHSKPDDADLTLDCAAALLAADQPGQAETVLSRLADANDSARAQSLLGEASEKQGRYQSAVEHSTRATNLDPSEENVWALGAEFLRHWSFDEAIRVFEAGAAKFPGSTRIRFGLGAASFGAERYTDAARTFAGLLNSDTNRALYAELLGMACTAPAASPPAVCSALIAYAEKNPRDARAGTYAASMLLHGSASASTQSEARTLITRALAADPQLAEARYEMGVLQQEGGEWAQSIPTLEAAVHEKPDLAEAHYRLALAYLRGGRRAEARTEMDLHKKYAQQDQENLDARLRQITTFIVNTRN